MSIESRRWVQHVLCMTYVPGTMHLLSHAVCIFPRRKVRLKEDKWCAHGPSYSDGAGFNLRSVWPQSLFAICPWRKQHWRRSCLPLTFQPAVWRTRLDVELTSSEFYSPPQICGWPCLLSCEVLGGMTTSIWAFISQVLVLAHVPAKVSQEVTKKQLPGFVAHERAPLWPSPVKLSCWFPEGSLQGTWWSKPTCYSQPPADSSPMHPLICWEQTWNWSENLPEWAYTPTF